MSAITVGVFEHPGFIQPPPTPYVFAHFRFRWQDCQDDHTLSSTTALQKPMGDNTDMTSVFYTVCGVNSFSYCVLLGCIILEVVFNSLKISSDSVTQNWTVRIGGYRVCMSLSAQQRNKPVRKIFLLCVLSEQLPLALTDAILNLSCWVKHPVLISHPRDSLSLPHMQEKGASAVTKFHRYTCHPHNPTPKTNIHTDSPGILTPLQDRFPQRKKKT